jgi:hypothetical protein
MASTFAEGSVSLINANARAPYRLAPRSVMKHAQHPAADPDNQDNDTRE